MATTEPGARPLRRVYVVPVVGVMVAAFVLSCAMSGSVRGAFGDITTAIPGGWRWTGAAGGNAALSRMVGDGSYAAIAPPDPAIGSSGAWWRPRPGIGWQLQLDGTLDPAATTSTGAAVFVLDLNRTDGATIAEIHARGGRAVCRMSTAVWEAGSATAGRYPAEILGRSVDGYADQRYVDLRQLDLLRAPLDARLQSCRDKGFDGVDPLGDDAVLDVGADGIGFPVTYADQLAVDRMVATDAHTEGLAIGLDSDIPVSDRFVHDLLPFSDFAVVEGCAAMRACSPFAQFIRAGRPVFEAEYVADVPGSSTTSWLGAMAGFCPAARALGFSAILKDSPASTTAWRQACS